MATNGDLAFAKEIAHIFSPKKKSQVTVTTGSTSLFRGPQKKKTRPAMSDLVKSTW